MIHLPQLGLPYLHCLFLQNALYLNYLLKGCSLKKASMHSNVGAAPSLCHKMEVINFRYHLQLCINCACSKVSDANVCIIKQHKKIRIQSFVLKSSDASYPVFNP